MGPGMYQEWTSQIGAARNRTEQNLELCRSGSNNMLFYKATRRIKCGDQLLAWFSRGVELELVRSLLKRDFLVSPSSSSRHRCRRNRRLHRLNHHHSSYCPPLLADNPHDSAVADAVAAAPLGIIILFFILFRSKYGLNSQVFRFRFIFYCLHNLMVLFV